LVHYTTQEYFKRTSSFPNAETDITVTCVTYLSFDTFAAGFCPTHEELEARLQLNPLYEYAARNWGYHVRVTSTEVEQLLLDFLENEAKVWGSGQVMMASGSHDGFSVRVPGRITGVHLGAYFGLRETIITLLKNGHEPDIKDIYGRTPLSWTAKNGHESVVKLLLEKYNVDQDSKDSMGRTPLSLAAENGREEVVTLLLAKDGVDVNAMDKYGQTPLSWAAANGQEAVLKLLLTRDGVDPGSKNSWGRTPQWKALWKGHNIEVTQLEGDKIMVT